MGVATGMTRIRQAMAHVIAGNQRSSYQEPKSANMRIPLFQTREFLATSHPVWGPEVGTHSGLSEGYSSITFKLPWVDFSTQSLYLQEDEDVQLAMNHLASEITGSDHYWKAKKKEYSDYMTKFSKKIWLDVLDTELVKELLWYGNTVLIPLVPLAEVQHRNDLLHVPISSFIRIWIDRLRKPYKYEFRGVEWQGYMNPQDVIHLRWNPVNSSPFGTGFGTALCASREFEEITPDGTERKRLPPLIDRKLATQMWMHISQKRYISRNVYNAPKSSADDRAILKAALKNLAPGEDFVTGVKVEVQELGTAQRNFDPTLFTNLVSGQIYKGLNDFSGKQGEESSHQYNNAKESAKEVEKGLASFPLTVTTQLCEYLFKPWYTAHPLYDLEYGGGIISVPWDDCQFELDFGQEVKRDLTPEQHHQLLSLLLQSGVMLDPTTILELFEDAGLAIRQETKEAINNTYNDPMGQMSMQKISTVSEQPNFGTYAADQASRPMDSPLYLPGYGPSSRFAFSLYDGGVQDPQPTKPYLNFGPLAEIQKKPKVSTKPII